MASVAGFWRAALLHKLALVWWTDGRSGKQLHCSCWIKNESIWRNTCPFFKPLHTDRLYRSFGKTMLRRVIRNSNYVIFSWFSVEFLDFSDYFPITQLVVWKTAAGLQMCLKQALHDRKQLLWRSLTKDFHENGKVEVKLRCFEVEVFTLRRSVPAYTLFEDISFTHCNL